MKAKLLSTSSSLSVSLLSPPLFPLSPNVVCAILASAVASCCAVSCRASFSSTPRSRPVVVARQLEEAKKKDVKKEVPKEISLLDGKRAMNTSIAIARIKMSYAETRQAIMNMEETALSSNVLQSLQVCFVLSWFGFCCRGLCLWCVRFFSGVALCVCACGVCACLLSCACVFSASWMRACIRVCARGELLRFSPVILLRIHLHQVFVIATVWVSRGRPAFLFFVGPRSSVCFLFCNV